MKKIILILLFILSLVILGVSFYFYKSNETTEKKSSLMRYIKKELEHKSLPTNTFDEKIENERYLITTTNFNINLNEKIAISECLYNTDPIFHKEKSIVCAQNLNSKIIEKIGEETFIKSIAHTYFTSGIKYLILGDDIQTEYFQENTEESTDYLRLISYSGFLYNLRTPEKLTTFYAKYKPLLQSFITKKIYDKYLEASINNLLEAHQKIENAVNKEIFIQKIYDDATNTYSHSDVKNWSITFWNRRILEKNDEIIYNILKDVKQYYDNK